MVDTQFIDQTATFKRVEALGVVSKPEVPGSNTVPIKGTVSSQGGSNQPVKTNSTKTCEELLTLAEQEAILNNSIADLTHTLNAELAYDPSNPTTVVDDKNLEKLTNSYCEAVDEMGKLQIKRLNEDCGNNFFCPEITFFQNCLTALFNDFSLLARRAIRNKSLYNFLQESVFDVSKTYKQTLGELYDLQNNSSNRIEKKGFVKQTNNSGKKYTLQDKLKDLENNYAGLLERSKQLDVPARQWNEISNLYADIINLSTSARGYNKAVPNNIKQRLVNTCNKVKNISAKLGY